MLVDDEFRALVTLLTLRKCKDQEWIGYASLKNRPVVGRMLALSTSSMNFNRAAIGHTSQLCAWTKTHVHPGGSEGVRLEGCTTRCVRILKPTDFRLQRPLIHPLDSTQSESRRLSWYCYHERVSTISWKDSPNSLLLFLSRIPNLQVSRLCHAHLHETLCAKAWTIPGLWRKLSLSKGQPLFLITFDFSETSGLPQRPDCRDSQLG